MDLLDTEQLKRLVEVLPEDQLRNMARGLLAAAMNAVNTGDTDTLAQFVYDWHATGWYYAEPGRMEELVKHAEEVG